VKIVPHILLILSVLISTPAWSEITIAEGGISGVSLYDATEKRIYGGVAGTCASPLSNSTCNTCTDAAGGLRACNQKSVHGALTISFNFTSSLDFTTGTLAGKKVYLKVGSSTSCENVLAEAVGLAPNTPYTLQTTWSEFCSRAGVTGLQSDCSLIGNDDVISTDFRFCIFEDTTKTDIPVTFHGIPTEAYSPTPNYTNLYQNFAASSGSVYGLYKYRFEAGDKKLILQEDFSTQAFTATMPTGTPELFGVAYFLDQQDSPASILDTSTFANAKFPITIHTYNKSTTRFDNGPYIENLENGFQYCVVTGQVNKAQNIFAFTTGNVDSEAVCRTPNPVVGILEDKKCFISTAAFGSDMASEVVLFRKFRDQILLKTSFGKWFIKTYYKYSPPLADFIAQSEFLRAVVRGILYPLWALAWLSLYFGFFPTVIALFFVLMALFVLGKNRPRWSL
jgi:hypothetical protein